MLQVRVLALDHVPARVSVQVQARGSAAGRAAASAVALLVSRLGRTALMPPARRWVPIARDEYALSPSTVDQLMGLRAQPAP